MATDRTALLFSLVTLACTGGGEFIANRAPQAFAGFDQVVRSGQVVVLDGRGSRDPDGNALTYTWNVLEPTDGSVQLDSPNEPAPRLTGSRDFSGRCIIQLTVSDGVEPSLPDLVAVRFSATFEALPVANAGNNFLHPDPSEPLVLSSQTIEPGVQQRWLHLLSPDAQLQTLAQGPEVEVSELTEGGYLFALLVEDSQAVSLPDFLAVAVGPGFVASDLPQITGPNSARIDEEIVLRATHSENGHWSIVNAPGNHPTLPTPESLGSGATSLRLTFEARGRYVLSVTAASGLTDWHALEVL